MTQCFERVVTAFDEHPDAAVRLSEACTTVAIRSIHDADCFRLLLDRVPVVAEWGDGPAEIEIWLSPSQLVGFAEGRLSLQHGLAEGRISSTGPIRKLLAMTAVLSAMLSEGRDHRSVPDEVDGDERPAAPRPAGDMCAIECRDVHKRLGETEVLRGADVTIPEGLVTVVVGPSGTGKSVLLKHMIGLLRPDAGDVLIRGRSLQAMSLQELGALRRRCGTLFQDGGLWASMSVFDNVALPLRQHTNLSEQQIAEAVREQLSRVGLAAAEDRMPSELSGGMRKRAGFARALVLDPEIVFFDEPDSGLDPVRTALLCDLVVRIHRELGGTYVIVTHDIRTARRAADHFVVLWQGRAIAAGPADEILASRDPFVSQFLTGTTTGPLGMD